MLDIYCTLSFENFIPGQPPGDIHGRLKSIAKYSEMFSLHYAIFSDKVQPHTGLDVYLF